MATRSSLIETRPPHVGIRRSVRRGGYFPAVLVVVLASLGAATAPNASAFGSVLPCTSRDSSAVFSRWLDPAQYFLASNGGFEQGAQDWSLSAGAAVVSGNESYQVGGPSDSHSLVLDAGASVESRTACVTMGEPTVRLFVKAPSVLGAVLRVDATVQNPTTGVPLTTTYLVVGGLAPAGWAPTPEILIPNLVGGVLPENLTLRITAQGTPATWAADDIYVDPFKSH
ncbi:MAG: hypothetical protein QOH28_1320 [Actinomycetota bacterium]|jgi:hypothetical protein|nr:hypothetical protein [Actinomycetota bacterium]